MIYHRTSLTKGGRHEKVGWNLFDLSFAFLQVVGYNLMGAKAADAPMLLGYAGWYLADPFQAALQNQTLKILNEKSIKYLQPTDARADAAKQVTDIQTLISQGANAIITLPTDTKAIMPAIHYANSKNVPVVTIDMAPEGKGAYMVVRADNIRMGEIAADWVGKVLNGKGKVLELQGDLANSNGRDRTTGFEKRMAAKFPGIEVVGRPQSGKPSWPRMPPRPFYRPTLVSTRSICRAMLSCFLGSSTP